MKKFLSLVLALVMTMSLVTVAGASFTDADDVNYDAAVDVISELGIVGGYADGSFNPDGTLTRQAAAKIICNIAVGPEAAADLAAVSAPFADVAAGNQFAGYIAYCVNEGIISGYADGTFKPANTLTGYAFLKMLLTTLGYDQNVEGYVGTNAQVNILLGAKDVRNAKGEVASLLDGFDGKFNGSKAITREEACLLALNALQTKTVKYRENGSNITIGDVQIVTGKGDMVYSDLLAEANFDMEKKDAGKDAEDKLGRPAYTWYVDDEAVGTYAKTADITIENEMDQDDLDDLFEDLTWKKAALEVTEAKTANGKTFELFVNDEDEIYDVVVIEPAYVSAKIVKKDTKATDEDERIIKVGTLYVVADKDEWKTNDTYKAGVELDNFDALYEALDEEENDTMKVLAVFTEDNTAVYSVEIPEVIEATITRVVDNTLVAGGEKYLAKTEWETTDEDVKLYVGANGVVYDVVGIDPDQSDVIYVHKTFKDTNKWNKDTFTAQIVNEDYEIVEVTLKEEYNEFEGKFCSYEIKDDKYVLEAANAADDKFYTAPIDIDDEDDRLSKKLYFAEDMVVVYIDDSEIDELAVEVKEGAQTIKATVNYVLNDDDDVAVIFVKGAYDDGLSEDVVYLADAIADAKVRDLEGDKRDAYEVYVDGEVAEWMITNAAAGYYKYDLDEKTGVYTLYNVTDAVYAEVKDGGFEVVKDKYVYCGAIEAATLTGEIYDLTEEGLFTLADIADYDGDPLKVAFIYDDEDKVITQLYVDFK